MPPRRLLEPAQRDVVLDQAQELQRLGHRISLVRVDDEHEVVTDEEMIEGLSFASFRRVATMIMVPSAPPHASSTEMVSIGSIDLADAQRNDASLPNE